MEYEVGQIVEGKISGIKSFGIFFTLNDLDTGFCHISKVSGKFIENIFDLYSVGDIVKTKIINVKENGQIELSIKDAIENVYQKPQNKTFNKSYNDNNKFNQSSKRKEPESFEDMLQAFMKNSESKFKDMSSRDKKRKH